MTRIRAPKKPCGECPWRKDVACGHFAPERYRALAHTAYDMSQHIFSCHKSSEQDPIACAGFVLNGARHNLFMRIACSRGDIDMRVVSDGGYDLFPNYRQMAIANGVNARDHVLRLCRDD